MVLTTSDWIMILTLIVGLLVVVLYILHELKFKHTVIIREIVNNRRIIIIDRAREYTDDSGVTFWKLKKERNKSKKLIPSPINDAIEITSKGRKMIEVYRDEEGTYTFIKDTNEEIKNLQPLTRNDRLTLIHSYKAAEFKNKKSLVEQIQQWVITGSLIILIVMALIFTPDIITSYTKGATQISDSLKAYEDIRSKNAQFELEQMERITQGIQTIKNVQTENQDRLQALEDGN